MSNFIYIKPKNRRFDSMYLQSKVRIIFLSKQNKQMIRIYIGADVAKKYGLQKGDRVALLASSEEKLIRLKQDKEGFKISKLKTQLILQAKWPFETFVGGGQRFVSFGMAEGLLELKLPEGIYQNRSV